MALNFVIPINIFLEIVMISIHGVAYHYARVDQLGSVTLLDQIYFTVVAFLAASIGWAWYFFPKGRSNSFWSRGIRYTEGLTLLIIGGGMIISSVDMGSHCECQKYELKLIAAILAMINGGVYFFPPCKFTPQLVAFFSNPPQEISIKSNADGVVGSSPPNLSGQLPPATCYKNSQYLGQSTVVHIGSQQMAQQHYKLAGQPVYARQT